MAAASSRCPRVPGTPTDGTGPRRAEAVALRRPWRPSACRLMTCVGSDRHLLLGWGCWCPLPPLSRALCPLPCPLLFLFCTTENRPGSAGSRRSACHPWSGVTLPPAPDLTPPWSSQKRGLPPPTPSPGWTSFLVLPGLPRYLPWPHLPCEEGVVGKSRTEGAGCGQGPRTFDAEHRVPLFLPCGNADVRPGKPHGGAAATLQDGRPLAVSGRVTSASKLSVRPRDPAVQGRPQGLGRDLDASHRF